MEALALIAGVHLGIGIIYGLMWRDYRKNGAPVG